MTNSVAPHKAILYVNIEVHEVLPTGECSGNIVSSNILKDKGLKKNIVLSVDGFDRFDCLKRLKEKLEEFNND